MEWFFTEVAGIKSDDAFKTVTVSPSCDDFISGFECIYNSVHGEISVKYENGAVTVSVPCNTKMV